MSKSAMIRARIEPFLKEEVEAIFKKLGLSTTEAISLFYYQVKLNRGLPFQIKVPNKTTVQTFKDTESKKNLIHCKDEKDMFKKLGI